MKNSLSMQKMLDEALEILSALGIPFDNLTERRKQKMAKVFLAVADLKPGLSWSQAKDKNDGFQLTSREIISSVNKNWGESISPGSYDDIRRKDLILPVEALIVLNSAKNPNANTNDGTRGFALSPLASAAIRVFGTLHWQQAIAKFHQDRPSLASQLIRERNLARIPVIINDNENLTFSAGGHSHLQKEIIEHFLPIFGFGAQVLYVGDTADKYLFLNEEGLKNINFFEIGNDKLPDVIAYSEKNNWLFLIEAVTTANPITELRRLTLLKLAEKCTADLIFITAFPDKDTYRKFSKDIAWETEVWISNAPEHMIHFNGDKFLGPHK